MDIETFLQQAPGAWAGEYRLWMRPAPTPDAESASRATITAEQAGRALLLRYDWRHGDDEHEGLAIIGVTDDGGLQMGWSDTFHARDGVMHNTAVGSGTPAVLARYGPAEAPWGWRTEFDMPSADELVIRAFNIPPDGTEALATEALYRRVV